MLCSQPRNLLLISIGILNAIVAAPFIVGAQESSIHALRFTNTSDSESDDLDTGEAFETRASPQPRPGRERRGSGQVYRDRVTPNWVANSTRFWYRNDLAEGRREFIVVDAVKGERRPAFDHAAVANAFGADDDPSRLPIESLRWDADGESLILIGKNKRWAWNAKAGTLQETAGEGGIAQGDSLRAEAEARRSERTGPESEITFDNRLDRAVKIFWIDPEGKRQPYGEVAAASRRSQHTFAGHRWMVLSEKEEMLGVFEAKDEPGLAVIDGTKPQANEPRAGDGRSNGSRGRRRGPNADRPNTDRPASDRSPDEKWVALIKEHNLWIRPASGGEEIALSDDGREGFAYQQFAWSPDSKRIVAFRVEPGERQQVHLLQSSPEGGGRAKLHSRPYSLPGDKFTTYELNLFDIENKRQLKPEVDRFEHEWLRPQLRWSRDGRRFAYEQIDRGHQRFRLIEVDASSFSVRNLIDERTETFIWTAHTENVRMAPVNWLEQSDECIYVSERSGWRHLYLVDTVAGQIKNAITGGEWVVRGIDEIDEENRQVWFRASGCFAGQDPYLIHYGRVNFDGTGLVWLTAGDGNHTVQYSPDRKYLIDSYSRVDLAPVTELRSVSDGKLVCGLEQADTEDLEASGWQPPEVFVAKGRDGVTDIWGIICRPRNFDPNLRYPIIEDLYAGPQSSYVPKTFSAGPRFESLTDLGFIVVKIDGMGTANRSKAFHDTCWKNLKDAGFEDRKRWMQAAAKKHPEMDLSRVGVYGVSAGGQNAAGAVLFHGDFYKVAVAGCGCHDNRMDKASWNEQWMGYPVGPHYAECSNVDNAHRLQGKLLLIVGEMDNNVPPESTLRVADALIRANKDFDLLVVPNAGHGIGGPYGQKRMHEFFVRHLLGREVTR